MREIMNAFEIIACMRGKANRCADNAFAASKKPGDEYKGQYRSSWLKQARQWEEMANFIADWQKQYAQEVQKIKTKKHGTPNSKGGPGNARNKA